MPVRNLDRVFSAQSGAVIGASNRPLSVGNSVLLNLTASPGVRVYAVNPKHKEVAGVACYPTVGDVPEAVDLAVICTPAKTVPDIVRQCGERGVAGVVILSAGFREIGPPGKILEAAVAAEAAKFPGLRIVGPNCLGFMAPHSGLNVSFVDQSPSPGRIAFISQSGALCSAVLDWAVQERIGFSYFVSLGNMLDVGVDDMLDYLATDPMTDSVVLYVESISEARPFMSAARAFTRSKPIIAYKAGRFAESAKAAASHTGAMAGVDSVYEAAFARAGIVRVFELDDLFDCAELLARRRRLSGSRLAIITNAGGPGVMATDALIAREGALAELSEATLRALDDCLPASWSHGNPIDLIGDATPERYRAAMEVVLRDEGVDGLLVLLSPQAMSDPTGTAQAVIEAASRSRKPVLTSWMGGARVAEGNELFRKAGIPNYPSPEKAVRAFMYLVTYERRQEVLYETPREVPGVARPDGASEPIDFQALIDENGSAILNEASSKAILERYGIPVSKTLVATTAEEVVAKSREIGYPVVLKLYSPDITHKSDVGGVELNISDDAAAEAAFGRILEGARRHRPDARVHGVTVQPMVTPRYSVELILGAKRDPVFGMVMLLGLGGTAAELLKDRVLELPPLNERLARRMLESLRVWPLLRGYRGKPAVDIDRLIDVLLRLSHLIADNYPIAEMDINPLLASPDGAIALDARIVVDEDSLRRPPLPYAHLAIRPYPDELIKTVQLKDGSQALLRPIRPEDEPMWHEFLGKCSFDTVHRRFRYTFKATTHQMATRFCFVDYDRELAIVAEQGEGDERRMIGVGQLISNADHTEAEYAVLVADPWQNLSLGTQLTDYCLEIAKRWGIEKVSAEMSADNHRMISMFQRRGFTSRNVAPDTIAMVKKLI